MCEPTVILLSPIGRARSEKLSVLERSANRKVRTVLLIDNTKPKADYILSLVALTIRRQFPASEIIERRKPHQATAAPFLDDLAGKVDLAVTALAD